MNNQLFESTRQLEFLTELVSAHSEVAGDIIQVGATTWAIHGWIPMDGEVLVAEYDSLESAQAALAQVPPNLVTDGSITVPTTRDRASRVTCTKQSVGAPAYFLGRNSATWRAALKPGATNRYPK